MSHSSAWPLSEPPVLEPGGTHAGSSVAGVLTRPRMRGWIHLYCAVAAVNAGTGLVVMFWVRVSKLAGHATLAYALAIAAMFAVSATYHRGHRDYGVWRAVLERASPRSAELLLALDCRRHFARIRGAGHRGGISAGFRRLRDVRSGSDTARAGR